MSPIHKEAANYREKNFWGAHPDHSIEDWQYEVRNDDTRYGYWEWVSHRLEEHDDTNE